ncbi:DISARM system helicase DrmA [uncultured Demequina sp.]|uniref:DISARM system helicase DrmA n=1 Tax=uncultured Demequina sp. TaxID=693499 RepID=UPI0025D0896F|nr:DISARM system helicase DrmA [uncultured Demequina sp.]
MTDTPTTKPDRPVEYALAHAPDGASWTDRENLTDILERELLGPANGENEVLEAQPDALYLVGRIAPAKLVEGPTPAAGGDDETDSEVVDDSEHLDRGVPVEPDGNDPVANDDDGGEDAPLRRGLMIPASMGLRFQVPRDLESVTVHSSWGTYHSQRSDEETPSGRPVRRYARKDHLHHSIVPVQSFTPGETETIVLEDRVVLRVDVMDQGDMRIVELALCNDKHTPRRIPVDAWLYQTRLDIDAGGNDVFLPVTDPLADGGAETDYELARLELQYRDRLEFAVGRTCSVDWAPMNPESRRTTHVRTTWLPVSETPQTRAREIEGATLDMLALADLADAGDGTALANALRPIVDGYDAWIAERQLEAEGLPEHLRETALDAVEDATAVAVQLRAGLDFLTVDAETQLCFGFMNRVMADQRIQSQAAEKRKAKPGLSLAQAVEQVKADGPKAHSWRTFQIAFVLMQIEALAKPHLDRRSSDVARAELLFFPTGGGKTEAYLGLAAFTFAIRRRQGVIESPDGKLDGCAGIAVLMRYTLRLLTAQQFQRATALVCAAEVARLRAPEFWGDEPFRIGLWVGTAVSPKRYPEAAAQLAKASSEGSKRGLTVLQLKRCPWCGSPIDAKNVKGSDVERRIRVYCGDEFGDCPFSEGGSAGEGLPVLTVDEEIYRLTPSFVIATVDKFARLAREGEAASLFGYVTEKCARHGCVHPDSSGCDLSPGGKHPAKDGRPAEGKAPVERLRPPDLVIQDELHLITGALGTAVGAFETAIDLMCSWRDGEGRPVRALVVASTATVRNAAAQIRGLYGRKPTIFPPQVLDVSDTYFSAEVPVSRETPGRRYVGVSTTGVRLTAAEIVVAGTLLSAGQLLGDRASASTPFSADPYMTLVAYFNATRELAGMARYMRDDVQTAVRKKRAGKNFPQRFGTEPNGLHIAELTSRASSTDITATLDQMAVEFGAEWDTTAARRARAENRRAGETISYRDVVPFDTVLATSMLQVGVDVTRLGLMMVVGQPKNTAEYIQASSRVGRDAGRPGLVVTLGNWARPRDLAHFEQFRHYHETFYSQVEPLSVTPYSLTAIERLFDGVLVGAARVLDTRAEDTVSTEKGAGNVSTAKDRLKGMIEVIVSRAKVAGGESEAKEVSERLLNRLGQWEKRKAFAVSHGKELVYERVTDETKQAALLLSPESSRALSDTPDTPPLIVANSMREVQPEINVLVTPLKEKLMAFELTHAPAWQASQGSDDD